MRKVITSLLLAISVSTSANSDCEKLDAYKVTLEGVTPYCMGIYKVFYDEVAENPVVGVTLINPKSSYSPVYTRDIKSKYNQFDDSKVIAKRNKAVAQNKDLAHLISPFVVARSGDDVLRLNADVNRLLLDPETNRTGFWKKSEEYAFKKSIELGTLLEISGRDEQSKVSYKVLVSPTTNATIAFMKQDGQTFSSLSSHITTINCIEQVTGHKLLLNSEFEDVKTDFAESIRFWPIGDGQYQNNECEYASN